MTILHVLGLSIPGFSISSLASDLASLVRGSVASAFMWTLAAVASAVQSTSRFTPGAAFLASNYRYIELLALGLSLPFVLWTVISALLGRSLHSLGEVVLMRIPMAFVAMGGGIAVASLASTLVDAASAPLFAQITLLDQLKSATPLLLMPTSVPSIVALLMLVVGLTALFLVWLELLLRNGLLYVAVAMFPLCCLGLVLPKGNGWFRRSAEVVSGLLVFKFVIALSLSLASGAIAAAASGGGVATEVASFLGGVSLLLATAFTPFLIVRIIPFAEAHVAAVAEGASTAVLRRGGHAGTLLGGVVLAGTEPSVEQLMGQSGASSVIPPYVGYQPSEEWMAAARSDPLSARILGLEYEVPESGEDANGGRNDADQG